MAHITRSIGMLYSLWGKLARITDKFRCFEIIGRCIFGDGKVLSRAMCA